MTIVAYIAASPPGARLGSATVHQGMRDDEGAPPVVAILE
jgi:hypothetical protein